MEAWSLQLESSLGMITELPLTAGIVLDPLHASSGLLLTLLYEENIQPTTPTMTLYEPPHSSSRI